LDGTELGKQSFICSLPPSLTWDASEAEICQYQCWLLTGNMGVKMYINTNPIWIVGLLIILFLNNPTLAQQDMKMDGDESDWINDPVLIHDPDNIEGFYPASVGAAVTDIVDIKQIKAKSIGDKVYFFIRFYGSPVWPNYAQKSEFNGVPVYRHRGYYHVIVDLDNDASTGWDTHWYIGHWTPVGYRHSLGEENTENIGGEVFFAWQTNMGFTVPHPDSGKVKEIRYSAEDKTYKCGETEECGRLYCFKFDIPNPDSIKQISWEGTYYDSVLNKSLWVGHGWGKDFLEMGFQIDAVKNYWKELGREYLQPGDTLGLAGFVETPIDDWGVDFTPRGELVIETGTPALTRNSTETENTFVLAYNYPNPFNLQTTIRYVLPWRAFVLLEIVNTSGQKVCTLVQQELPSGTHQIKWDGKDDFGNSVASGVYLIILRTATTSLINRMLLLR